MLKKRYFLYLDEIEYRVLIRSLVQMKNRLIHEGRFTDCVDELILKVLSAPVIKNSYIPNRLLDCFE